MAKHHATVKGIWLIISRRRAESKTIDYETAVVEALRYGWIDATTKSLDEERRMMWFSPRKPGSGWAKSNKQRIAALEAEGRLESAGAEAVRVAKANGTWAMLDDVDNLVVPPDLDEALSARSGARKRWDETAPSRRKMALTWIVQAKRPETRARRIEAVADRAAAGRSLT